MESHRPMEENDHPSNAFSRIKRTLLPGIRIGLLISLIIYFAMLIVGSMGWKKCPVNDNIPLFLIAAGAIGIISKLVTYTRDRIDNYFQVKYLESALYMVETIFLALGSYWVFNEFQPNYNPTSGKLYCQKTLYLVAFTYLAVLFAIMIATILGYCCFLATAWVLGRNANRDPESQRSMPDNNV